jgi:preprotein translocase subunit SecA
LVEYKQAAFESFQDLTDEIQREIVRALLNVRIQRMEPGAEGQAPQSDAQAPVPSAGGDNGGAAAPPARPAAAAASGALARAAGARAAAGALPAQPTVRNIVESSAAGSRRLDGASGSQPATNGDQRKVGRNQLCPCGSGKKYKYCHGR